MMQVFTLRFGFYKLLVIFVALCFSVVIVRSQSDAEVQVQSAAQYGDGTIVIDVSPSQNDVIDNVQILTDAGSIRLEAEPINRDDIVYWLVLDTSENMVNIGPRVQNKLRTLAQSADGVSVGILFYDDTVRFDAPTSDPDAIAARLDAYDPRFIMTTCVYDALATLANMQPIAPMVWRVLVVSGGIEAQTDCQQNQMIDFGVPIDVIEIGMESSDTLVTIADATDGVHYSGNSRDFERHFEPITDAWLQPIYRLQGAADERIREGELSIQLASGQVVNGIVTLEQYPETLADGMPYSSPTPSPSPTATHTLTSTPTATQTVTLTPTHTATITPTFTATPTVTATTTFTPTATDTATLTPTLTPTATETATATDEPASSTPTDTTGETSVVGANNGEVSEATDAKPTETEVVDAVIVPPSTQIPPDTDVPESQVTVTVPMEVEQDAVNFTNRVIIIGGLALVIVIIVVIYGLVRNTNQEMVLVTRPSVGEDTPEIPNLRNRAKNNFYRPEDTDVEERTPEILTPEVTPESDKPEDDDTDYTNVLSVEDVFDEDNEGTNVWAIEDLQESIRMPAIAMLMRNENDTMYDLLHTGSVLGSGSECEITLSGDAAVAQRHLRFDMDQDNRITVTPLTDQPVFINGERFTDTIQLQSGDVIQVSPETQLTFLYVED